MKCNIPEISWHNREPVLCADVHPSSENYYKLATGGCDAFLLIWQLKVIEGGNVEVDVLCELQKHQKSVNTVKWSPNGQYLASGDDEGNVIVWHQKSDNVPLLDGDDGAKEVWLVYKILRGHENDVYDLCWSPDSTRILSGAVDNTAILWDAVKGKFENRLRDHKGFVQGVAWDPKNQFICTLSSDRVCRIFDSNGKHVKARLIKGLLPVEESHSLYNKEVKYFHDDTFKTFFRRLSFSPDGSILVVPSGCVETEDLKCAMYGTYIFKLDSFQQPAAILPSQKQSTIVAKCSPVLYELQPDGPKPYVDLPYRMLIAVATDSDIALYDTQQLTPFALLQKVHYTRLTDLTWSQDGLLLVGTSTDGYVTMVTFEDGELGARYTKEESTADESMLNTTADVSEEKVEDPVEVKSKKPSFLEQWAKNAPKRKNTEAASNKAESKKMKIDEVIEIEDSPAKEQPETKTVNVLQVKRKIGAAAEGEQNPKRDALDVEKESAARISKANELTEKEITPAVVVEVKQVSRRIIPTLLRSGPIGSTEDKATGSTTPVKTELVADNKSKKRITPITLSSPRRSTPIPAKTDAERRSIFGNKRDKLSLVIARIEEQGEMEDDELIDDSSDNDDEEEAIVATVVDEELKNNKESSPKNKPLFTPEHEKSNETHKKHTLQNHTPKVVQENETPSSKKKTPKPKKANTSPGLKNNSASKKKANSMSLLQFFKPITSTEKKTNEEKETVKMKTSNLFKSPTETEIIDITEDTTDAPEDFTLQLEDTMDGVKKLEPETEHSDDNKVPNKSLVEKENSKEMPGISASTSEKNVESKKGDSKQGRRIPLITLHSPKNKKKPTKG